jgi:hypothetical protein
MSDETRYTAERAADLALLLCLAAGVMFLLAGARLIRDGSAYGWLLVALGVIPFPLALLVRRRIRNPPGR